MEKEFIKTESQQAPYNIGQRLNKLEKTVEDMTVAFDTFKTNSLITDTRVAERLDQLIKDNRRSEKLQEETSRKIDNLIEQQHKSKSDRWDTVIKTIITAIVSGLVVYALTQLGLK